MEVDDEETGNETGAGNDINDNADANANFNANANVKGVSMNAVDAAFVKAFICFVHNFNLIRSSRGGSNEAQRGRQMAKTVREKGFQHLEKFLKVDDSQMAKHFQYRVCDKREKRERERERERKKDREKADRQTDGQTDIGRIKKKMKKHNGKSLSLDLLCTLYD